MSALAPPPHPLQRRFDLVREVLARSPEPLHVPLRLDFRPQPGAAHLADWEAHAASCAAGTAFAPATLYVNVPFCARVCTFCLLSASRLPSAGVRDAYAAALLRQLELYAPIAERLRFHSLHVGGGTPTLLTETQLDELFGRLARFPRGDGFQAGVEAHPASATTGKLEVLARHGVHRLSFGLETLTPAVLERVNRGDQTEARVRTALAEARRLGFSINVDLLAGLPGETPASWATTVEKTLELGPDSLSVNRFLGENSELARFGFGPDARENERVGELLLAADALIRAQAPPRWPERALGRAGFGAQYVWDRTDAARRYFQNDMIGPVSTLAFGHGALGHLHGQHFSVAAGPVDDYVGALARGAHPEMLVSPSNAAFERAFYVAEHACRGDLTTASFRTVFGAELTQVYGDELRFLAERGLLRRHGERLAKEPTAAFQVAHLLAFLLQSEAELEADLRSLAPPTASVAAAPHTRIHGRADVEALRALPAEALAALALDVGTGLDVETAALLRELAAEKQLHLQLAGSDHRETAQYAALGVELPPSMLWVRFAIRASQASRGEQRRAVALTPFLDSSVPV